MRPDLTRLPVPSTRSAGRNSIPKNNPVKIVTLLGEGREERAGRGQVPDLFDGRRSKPSPERSSDPPGGRVTWMKFDLIGIGL